MILSNDAECASGASLAQAGAGASVKDDLRKHGVWEMLGLTVGRRLRWACLERASVPLWAQHGETLRDACEGRP